MSIYHDIRVGVLSGGPSSEYDVSLETGKTLLHEARGIWRTVKPVYIDQEGEWRREDGVKITPSSARHSVDVMINALHGEYGEDGKVQQVLEHMSLPYTGSSIYPSALAMNKYRAREKVKELSIQQPVYRLIRKSEFSPSLISDIYQTFPFPLVVKPTSLGSSVGVYIVQSVHDLEEALRSAFQITHTVMIEEYVRGVEATCGVVDDYRGEKVYALPVVEIRPRTTQFFDYQAKYDGSTEEIVPGNFTEEDRKKIQESAKMIHEFLGLRDYSRTDFIVHPRRGIFLLEVNTLPGMTSESLFPKSLTAVGSSIQEFLKHIVHRAYKRK